MKSLILTRKSAVKHIVQPQPPPVFILYSLFFILYSLLFILYSLLFLTPYFPTKNRHF